MNTTTIQTDVAPASAARIAYSAADLMAAFGISRVTLWRIESRGLIRAVPGVRNKIYSAAEVKRFLEGKAP